MPQVTSRKRLQPGFAGLKQTVDLIRKQIVEGGKDWKVRREAELMTRHVPAHDYEGEIRAIFEGVLAIDQPPYRKDPVNVEMVKGAVASAVTNGNDCDCMTTRAGALCESLGHPVRVVTMGRERPAAPAEARFSHVYIEVYDEQKRRWIPFDPVLRDPKRRPNAGLGLQATAGVIARFPVQTSAVRRFHPSMTRPPRRVVTLQGVDSPEQLLGFSLYNDLLKKIDPTRKENEIVRSIASAIPGGGAALAVIDTVAKVNNATQPLQKAAQAVISAAKPAIAAAAPAIKLPATVAAPAPASTMAAQVAAKLQTAPKAASGAPVVAATAAKPLVVAPAAIAPATAPVTAPTTPAAAAPAPAAPKLTIIPPAATPPVVTTQPAALVVATSQARVPDAVLPQMAVNPAQPVVAQQFQVEKRGLSTGAKIGLGLLGLGIVGGGTYLVLRKKKK